MAPLDFGSTSHIHVVDPLRVTAPEAYDTLGGYLQAVRERRGQDLDELAELTRIRRQHLVALEEGDRSALPSRPFAIGYVRAYAAALGLDAEVAAARFKAEWPEGDERLRNPVGLGQEGDPRRPILYAALAVVVGAVVLWNVAQRTLIGEDGGPSVAAVAPAPPPAPPEDPARLAAPVAAPAESSPPAPYLTPGMDPAVDAATAAAADAAKRAAASKAALAPSPGPLVFTTRRPIAGAASGGLILQAREKSVSLVVRQPGGEIAFATVLQPGEAFRAPAGAALTAEASEPGAIDAYVGGRLVGALIQPQTPLAALAPAAVPAPAVGTRNSLTPTPAAADLRTGPAAKAATPAASAPRPNA